MGVGRGVGVAEDFLGVLKFFEGKRGGVKISEGRRGGCYFFLDAIERLSICNIIENHCTSEVPYFFGSMKLGFFYY